MNQCPQNLSSNLLQFPLLPSLLLDFSFSFTNNFSENPSFSSSSSSMASSVRVKEAIVITPAEPTPHRFLSLSAIDSQLFLRFTIEYLFLYTPHPPLNQPTISSLLKSAFSKLLVPYYPLAGRVRTRSDGSGLEVVCRAQGALFLEAVSDHSSAEFNHAPPSVSARRRFLSFCVDDVLNGSPPLVVQLTWLKDGAAALGVGFNHCLCDGIGSADFLNAVAQSASSTRPDSIPIPVWNRHLLNPTRIPTRPLTQPEFNRVPDLCGFHSRFSNEPLVPTAITFTTTNLNNLKNIAQYPKTRPGFTSFEVVSSHIWRSWARSMNFPDRQILKLLFSINVRKRMKPNLPSGYYGNAFVLGCAQATAGELVTKGLGYVAGLVRKAKEKVGDEYVRKVVEVVSESRASPDSVGVLIMSQWSRLGLERVDFGFGRPVHVGPVCADRYCILLPVYNQTDTVKAMVAVPASVVDQYEALVRNAGT